MKEMKMKSSWNPDRVAAACLGKRSFATRRPQHTHTKSQVKVMKASDLLIAEYGEKAYNAWKLREAEIDTLMRDGRHSKYEIIQLREDNFRQMKAEGAQVRDARIVRGMRTRQAA